MNLSERPRVLWAGDSLGDDTGDRLFRLGNIYTLHFYEYRAQMDYNDETFEIRPNDVGFGEPYSSVRYHSHQSKITYHLALNFQLPENTREFEWYTPVIISPSQEDIEFTRDRLLKIIRIFKTSPMHAEVETWALLLHYCHRSEESIESPSRSRDMQRLRVAYARIENGLSNSIYAEDIARDLNISTTHLSRLFKKHAGCPLGTYIRRRRIKRAHELLVYSDKPIKEIAELVGIPDLANFNRLIRREMNNSPRKVRELKEGLTVRKLIKS